MEDLAKKRSKINSDENRLSKVDLSSINQQDSNAVFSVEPAARSRISNSYVNSAFNGDATEADDKVSEISSSVTYLGRRAGSNLKLPEKHSFSLKYEDLLEDADFENYDDEFIQIDIKNIESLLENLERINEAQLVKSNTYEESIVI